jgi:peroxiredoxin
MPNFKTAVSKRTDKEVVQIEHQILDWESLSVKQKKVVSNLYKEHFSPVSVMDKFVNEIIPHITSPVADFQKKVFELYENHTQSGDKASITVSINNLGFSLTRYTLKSVIERDHFDIFYQDQTEVDKFLNLKAINGKDPLYDHLPIKGTDSTIWLTWSESSDDPFDFMIYNRREEVYNALALSDHYRTTPIFVFRTDRNKITSKSVLLRPTVFDAGNYAPFLPADTGFTKHGFTDPHNDPALIIHGLPLVNNKCPEAIIDGSPITWNEIDNINEL